MRTKPWAATGAGAFTLSENGLYTVEAWSLFLDRLAPGGILSVSRWFAPQDVSETTRLLSLAVATLLRKSVTNPSAHMALASAGSVATLLVSNAPLSERDVAKIRSRFPDFCTLGHVSTREFEDPSETSFQAEFSFSCQGSRDQVIGVIGGLGRAVETDILE